MTEATQSATGAAPDKPGDGLLSWQLRLLPVMAGVLIVLMVVSLVSSLYYYSRFTESLKPVEQDFNAAIDKMLETKDADPHLVRYRVAVMFEEMTVKTRHKTWFSLMALKTWTRFMVLLLAICLCTSGCAFILGKIDATFDGDGEGGGLKANVKTNSPGLLLVFAGVVLAYMATTNPVELEAEDRSYLAGYLGNPASNGSGVREEPEKAAGHAAAVLKIDSLVQAPAKGSSAGDR